MGEWGRGHDQGILDERKANAAKVRALEDWSCKGHPATNIDGHSLCPGCRDAIADMIEGNDG